MDLIKENTFADICENCEFVSSCFSNIDSCIKKTFDAVLETLTPREKETLKLLYGYNSVALSRSEAAQHFNITEERISQIHAKALRKLRHPSRSKPLLKFAFDVLSSDARNFYALLLSDLFGETSYYIKLLYGVRLGVDFSLIYEQYCAKKTPVEIRDELSSNIFDFEKLTECNEYLKAANISTLIQLLHTSRKTLLFKIFNGNDVAYFKLIKNLKNMGYRIKDEEQEDELYSFLINNIYQTIAPKAIYDQPLINFPLEITFLLLDKDISTVGELLSNFHLLHNSTGFTESIITTIEEFLMSQKLIYKFVDGTSLYFNNTGRDFCNCLTKWLMENNFSILSLQKELQEKQLYFADAIHYIIEKYTDFKYSEPYIDNDTFIETFDFTVGTYNLLKRIGIDTVGDFSLISPSNADVVTKIKNRASKTILKEILAILNKYNLNSNETFDILNSMIASEEVPEEISEEDD